MIVLYPASSKLTLQSRMLSLLHTQNCTLYESHLCVYLMATLLEYSSYRMYTCLMSRYNIRVQLYLWSWCDAGILQATIVRAIHHTSSLCPCLLCCAYVCLCSLVYIALSSNTLYTYISYSIRIYTYSWIVGVSLRQCIT